MITKCHVCGCSFHVYTLDTRLEQICPNCERARNQKLMPFHPAYYYPPGHKVEKK